MAGGSDKRPGVGEVASWLGVPLVCKDSLRPGRHRFYLFLAEEGLQIARHLVPCQQLKWPEEAWVQFLSSEIPNDGAKLRVSMEAEAMVYAPDVAVLVEQAVAAFPVRVVGD